MDPLIETAARALAAGDPLSALKRVSLRDDPPALALRGTAIAQLGDLPRARALLRAAARGFGAKEAVLRARCRIAEAEVALVTRDLAVVAETLRSARRVLTLHGDRANAAHASYLEARLLLLVGRIDEAEHVLASCDVEALRLASRAGYRLVEAGVAMRRLQASVAREALRKALQDAQATALPALVAEVKKASRALDAPAAQLISREGARLLDLSEVEALISSGTLVVDACRGALRMNARVVSLGSRPVLFALARILAEAWPRDAARKDLIRGAFRGRQVDESHRARLRVEIGRLRREIAPLAEVMATSLGFRLAPRQAETVTVLAPPVETDHAQVLALLEDGESWSTASLALALGVSARTVQRLLAALAEAGKVDFLGRGPARRWVASRVPGFPTSLLLPGALEQG